ncbi:Uncharacterised protein [Mycobacteroides abscessus subsp. abscessus]|nr:Uncharacterised protein [Mycobacteroides abscessus subsp. abscessus]
MHEVIARVGLEDAEEFVGRVRAGGEPARGEDLAHLAVDDRDVEDAVVVELGLEDADEAAFADDLAGLVEGLHPDVVHERSADDAGARVRLREHEDVRFERLLGHGVRQRGLRERTQGRDPQRRVLDRFEAACLRVVAVVVLAVAEEREVAVEPGEQLGGGFGLGGELRTRRLGMEFGGDRLRLLGHRGGVLRGGGDVVEDAAQLILEGREVLLGETVDLEPDPRLLFGVVGVRLGGVLADDRQACGVRGDGGRLGG